MTERHSCRFRYWDCPEPGPAALSLLATGSQRGRLKSRTSRSAAISGCPAKSARP